MKTDRNILIENFFYTNNSAHDMYGLHYDTTIEYSDRVTLCESVPEYAKWVSYWNYNNILKLVRSGRVFYYNKSLENVSEAKICRIYTKEPVLYYLYTKTKNNCHISSVNFDVIYEYFLSIVRDNNGL